LDSCPFGPDEPRPLDGSFVPHSLTPSHVSPVPLLKFQIACRLRLLTSFGSTKKIHVRVKLELHTYTKHGLRFLPLLHTSYIRGCWSAPLSEMSSQGVVSSKEASDSSGLCPFEGQKFGLSSWTGAEISFRACLFVLIRPSFQSSQ